MRYIFIFLFFNILCYSQIKILDDNNGLRVLFQENKNLAGDSLKLYFLTDEDILILEKDWEKLIHKKTPKFKQSKINLNSEDDWANTKIEQYNRQYSGFSNLSNEVIVFINFLAKDDVNNNLNIKKNWVSLSCCKSYRMTYNFTKKTFENLTLLKLN